MAEKVKGLDQKDFPSDKDLQGFEDVGISVEQFWSGEGKLLCRPLEKREVEVNGQDACYYAVTLLAAAHCVKGKGKESEVSMQPKGTVIGVWGKAQLVLDDLKNCSVFIERGEKVKLDGTRTMWKFTMKSKGQRGEKLPVISRSVKSSEEGGGNSDIPF